MKYQHIKHIENDWKWQYLIKKYREGKPITRDLDNDLTQQAIDMLLKYKKEPICIQEWIQHYINIDLQKKMQQTIRARRKRYFNSQNIHTSKKSIDLEYLVWQRLSILASNHNMTLSAIIMKLIEDAESKKQYVNKMSSLQKDLQSFFTKDK
ncbi:Macrodomain Ter protein [Candidatus Profftia lariciata]|uniref:macrodomain Ter protein MatP n=1 Tax=Candidatus Profftia lariciata TaxID=1987921 RepID=UPI001D00C307|nr:macrodomain Ter protein MatP [Candidatus Profftia lariciata]UDG81423.1 Macrodomain Ter protein [Candidatus Profftia lariciata]